MIVPRTHDKLLLVSIAAVAGGVVMARGLEGSWRLAGLALLIAGGIGLVAGIALKTRAGR